jgi:hypothetical protein
MGILLKLNKWRNFTSRMLNWGLILEELGLRNEPSTCVAGVGCWAGVPQDLLVEKLNKYFGRYFGISKQQERGETQCKKFGCIMFGTRTTFKTKSYVDSLPRSGFIFRNTEIIG